MYFWVFIYGFFCLGVLSSYVFPKINKNYPENGDFIASIYLGVNLWLGVEFIRALSS